MEFELPSKKDNNNHTELSYKNFIYCETQRSKTIHPNLKLKDCMVMAIDAWKKKK